ncbi:two-component system, sensor histidine kinase and response regulator [Candidatus Magnetomoraceae bacterium gMMP-1]
MLDDKIKLLAVVNDQAVIQQIKNALDTSNYNIFFTSSLKKTLTLLNNHDFALIIVDLQLPDDKGFSILNYIELEPGSIGTVMTLTDSMVNSEITNMGIFKLGLGLFLKKPFYDFELKSLVHYSISLKSSFQLIDEIEKRKKTELALEKEKKRSAKLQNANKAKSEFLANMSHDIRTPMNGIIGITDMLFRTPLNEKQKKYLTTINDSANALLEIINDILDISKIEAGMLILKNISFNLFNMIENQAQLLTASAMNKDIEIIVNYPSEAPKIVIGDPTRVRQVLVNLMGNAIKFTEKGHVIVSVDYNDVNEFIITIEDTGIGIPEDKIENIFEKFSQADSSTTRQYNGTGLGLTISKKLIEKIGGSIGVTSQVDKGSKFYFTLPLKLGTEESISSDSEQIIYENDTIKFSAKILLVEDNEVNLIVAVDMLELMGCMVEIANNGKQAIEKIETNYYDLVFMDCQMPVMDGYEAARTIRSLEKSEKINAKHIPIIAMTANTMQGDREKCIEAGMDDHIAKPVHYEIIEAMLLKYLSNEKNQALKDNIDQVVNKNDIEIDINEFPILDNKHGLKFTDGKTNLLKKAVKTVIDRAPKMIGIFNDAFTKKINKPAIYQAYSLKNSAATIGAKRLEKIADRMQNALKRNDFTEGELIIKCLKLSFEELQAEITNYDNTINPVSTLQFENTPAHYDNTSLKVFDLEKGLKNVNGKKPLFEKVIKMFIGGAINKIQSLKEYISQQDQSRAKREAHSFKSSALTIGAERLGELARQTEMLIKEGNFIDAKPLSEKFESEFNILKNELKNMHF